MIAQDAELSNRINYLLTKPGREFRKAIGSFEWALIDYWAHWAKHMKLSPSRYQAECQLAKNYGNSLFRQLAVDQSAGLSTRRLGNSLLSIRWFVNPPFRQLAVDQSAGEIVCKLIIRSLEVEFNHSIFHLLSDEMVPYVDVFRARVLDVVTAKSNSTFVITVHRNFIEVKSVTHVNGSFQVPKDTFDSFKVLFGRLSLISSTHANGEYKVGSKNINHSEPNHTWGSNATDIPSSSSLFMTGKVRFGNDQGESDDGLWGMVTISGKCLLYQGSRDTNLYTISLDDMLKTSLICLLSKASKTKSWLWHRRCALGKSKKSSHQPKAEDTNQEKLYLLHMDLCGPMRVASINGKRYILVIVDDYSRFTWVRFLRTKDEAPEAIIKCIKNIQVRLNATVCNVRTDNGTEFVNETLREFYENVGISYQTSVAAFSAEQALTIGETNSCRSARTMLIFFNAPLFLWAEAINTACYTQNCSLIRLRYNKTPYELMQDKKPDLSFFYVFGSLCYPTNDNDDLGKLDAKANISIFVGYAPVKKAFRIYNKRTQKIIETIHVTFDELTSIASK
ncbi:retrovirus-related pol polyprotein from transposon TNT 1-94 [Tanacetum coccineum]